MTDSATAQPIADVRVVASFADEFGTPTEYETVTNGAGLYELAVPAGTYDLVASKTRYLTVARSGVIVDGAIAEQQNFIMQPLPRAIYGTVTDDATGLPLKDVFVTASGAGEYFALTDQAGLYELYLPAGEYDVAAGKSGYQLSEIVKLNFDGVNALPQNFSLVPPVAKAIYGMVKDATTQLPLQGASVTVSSSGDESVVYEIDTTDVDGAYEFTLSAGTYDVRVSKFSYEPKLVTGVYFDGVDAVLRDVFLQPAVPSIEGAVTDAQTGLPVSAAKITAWYEDEFGSVSEQFGHTDSAGAYAFYYLLPETYHMTVTKSGYMGASETSVVVDGVNAAARNFVLQPKTPTVLTLSAPATVGYGKTATLSGTLKTNSGSPLSGSVKVEVSTDGQSWGSPMTVTATSGVFTYTSAALTSVRHFRATYAGSDTYANATSGIKKVTPDVSLTAPATTITQTFGITYTASGYLMPKHTAGTDPVKIYAYHYEKRSDGTYGYVYKQSFAAKASDYSSTTSKYTASVKLPYAGNWRLSAYHAADALNSETYSSYTNVTVKAPTTLSLSAPSTSNYRSARLAGRLYDSNGKTVYNKRIELQYSYDKVKWTTFAAAYTTKKDSKGWLYEYTAKPSRKTYYRARFAGDDSYYSDYSAIDATLPKVYVTRPSFGRTTLAYGKTYKATGYLKPRHKAYSYPVKIAAYRYENGKYRWKKSYAAKAYNYSSYTKYVRSIKLPSKGKWRLRVVHAADSLNAKTYSSYRYVTVK